MLRNAFLAFKRLIERWRPGRVWAERTLVVGPVQPVDGDSVASTKALILHLRKLGKEAFTLPTVHMYKQLRWILHPSDLHPTCLPYVTEDLTTACVQQAYDALLEKWRPDEIVLVDGQAEKLGFDTRGVSVFTVDHHLGHGPRDDRNAYIQPAPAAGCLLIERFGICEPILAVAILTDTFWLRKNMPGRAVDALYALRRHGLTDEVLSAIQSELMVPKDPRVLEALRGCDLRYQGTAAFVVLKEKNPEIHRDVVGILGYTFRHLCVVRADGYVSLSTKDNAKSVRPIAIKYGGDGHRNSAAGYLQTLEPSVLDDLQARFMAEFGDCQ
jgi:nanoRNase/pAp phosphatase (c-di-AMP/oligoRNAs hydrolase)